MFHIGQRVVCIDDKFPGENGVFDPTFAERCSKLPVQGRIYTVRGFVVPYAGYPGTPGMLLEGVFHREAPAKQGIRLNSVAPGIVDTPMHKDDPKTFLRTLQPMGQISSVKDIVDAIVYLTEAGQVTGEVLHVDGGAHVGRW